MTAPVIIDVYATNHKLTRWQARYRGGADIPFETGGPVVGTLAETVKGIVEGLFEKKVSDWQAVTYED